MFSWAPEIIIDLEKENELLMWILHSYIIRWIEKRLIMPFVPKPIWWSISYIINNFEYRLTNPVHYVSVAWTTHYHMHTIKEKKGVLSIVITTSFLKGKFMNASKFKLTLEFKTMWVSFQCVTIIIKKVCFCIIMRYSPNGLAIYQQLFCKSLVCI